MPVNVASLCKRSLSSFKRRSIPLNSLTGASLLLVNLLTLLAQDRKVVAVAAQHRCFILYANGFGALVQTATVCDHMISQLDRNTVQPHDIDVTWRNRG